MKYMLMLTLLTLTVVLGVGPAFGQGASGAGPKKARVPADYQPRTLSEVAAMGNAGGRAGKESGVVLFGDLLPSRVRVTYGGSTRPLSGTRKGVLHEWAQNFAGAPTHYTAHYVAEALFLEGGTQHWLAVDPLKLGKELTQGEALDLFVIRLASIGSAREREWLILVESFQKQP